MKNQLLAFALMSAAFVGCTDDSYDLDNISNEYRIGLNEYLPIASSQVKLKDILTEFKTDYIAEKPDDNVLHFVFDTVNRVYVKPIDLILNETDYVFSSRELPDLKIEGGKIPANSPFSVKIPLELKFDSEDGEGQIDLIDVKKGAIRFNIDIDDFDASSIAVVWTNIPHSSVYPGNMGFDLSGQKIDLAHMDSIEITLSSATEIDLAGRTEVDVKVTMLEDTLKYNRIYGSFASTYEQIERTDFYINLYDDNLTHNLKVVDPQLKITGVTNSGIPLLCSVKKLTGKHKTNKSSKKDSIVATFRQFESNDPTAYKFDFQQATDPAKPVQAFSETFDKAHGSNLDEIFNYLPDSISVACGIRINADPASGVQYFLSDSTYLDLKIEADVPLQFGDSSYLIIRDTVDKINIVEEITDYQNGNFQLDQAEIYVEFENELPLEGVVTAHFCKADTVDGKVKLTRINNPKLDQTVRIPAAEITNGFVTKAKPSLTKISVSDDLVEDIKKINAVDFTYNIKVPRGSVNGVFLTNDCGMSAKIYGHVKANISNSEKK